MQGQRMLLEIVVIVFGGIVSFSWFHTLGLGDTSWSLTMYSIWYPFFFVFLSFIPLSLIFSARQLTGNRESMPRVYSRRVSYTNLYWA